jgi:glycosyltransferase involved in cell wall biosynthesis
LKKEESPLRILHVITKLDVGGAQSVVAELVREQIKNGHAVFVATGVVWDGAEVSKVQGVQIKAIDSLVHQLAPSKDRDAVRELADLMRAEQIDIVHTHSSKGGLLGRFAARRCKISSIYTAHGWPFQTDAPPRQRIQSFFGEWVAGRIGDEIVCVSASEAALAAKLKVGRRNHRHVIYNGIAFASPIRRVARARSDVFEIVTVARLHPQKRVDLVIRAMAELDERARLTIVGDGDLRSSLEQIVRELRLTDRVHFAGLCDPNPFFEAANVFALASEWEGMPVTVLEAMRAGLPVVANNLPGNREAVGTDSGVLTDKSAHAIAAALRKLMDDPESCEKMGSAGRRRWEDEFTAPASAARYEKLYGSVLHSERP